MGTPVYWDYLHLPELLSLQGGLEGDEDQLMSDELHFIVVHQAFELWFKLILRELRLARDVLSKPEVPDDTVPYVVQHLRRVTSIVNLLVDQFAVMETLTPQDFLAFRDKLVPASGFQSFQLRELEIILGLEDSQRVSFAGADPLDHIRRLADSSPAGALAWQRIESARAETTLKSALSTWLHRTPVQGSTPQSAGDDAVIDRFLEDYLAVTIRRSKEREASLVQRLGADPAAIATSMRAAEARTEEFLQATDVAEDDRVYARRVRAGLLFIESYRELPLLSWPRLLIDTVVELEEQIVIFRSRHARMVERIIGRRVGTGGSSGVDYLDRTAAYRVFDELWAVRMILLPKAHVPALEHPEVYGFAT